MIDSGPLSAMLWGALAAGSLIIGYLLSARQLSTRAVGLVMGIGSGALIGAVAYELVPETLLNAPGVLIACALGAITFFAGDWWIDRRGGAGRKGLVSGAPSGSGATIFLGTLLDGIPESIVLGINLAIGGAVNIAFLAAVLISNIPEGIAGSLNLMVAGQSRPRILRMWLLLVVVSALCAVLGYGVVLRFPASDGHLAQAFAAGAVLTMLSEAMIPEAHEHGGKLVGLFTVLGFLGAAALSILD